MTDRDERIETYYNWPAWDLAEKIVEDLAERIVDLEDKLEEAERLWREREKDYEKQFEELFDKLMRAENALDRAKELDPSRLESALRLYMAELDYDLHKSIADPEDGGPDRYPEEVDFFLRCWEVAGEG